jgi:hypothetical protein
VVPRDSRTVSTSPEVISRRWRSIGYVEYGYATQGHIPFASLNNASGQFVAPSTASTNAASAAATYPTEVTQLTFSLNNSPASGAYPLVTPTYILIAQKQKDSSTGSQLKGWLEWDLASAQQNEVLIALFLTEIAPARIATPLGYLVDLLAAVPSVVYGLWGVFVLVPFLTPTHGRRSRPSRPGPGRARWFSSWAS